MRLNQNENEAALNDDDAAPAFALQEQPGGRVALVDGVPFSTNRLQVETDAAFARLWSHYGWLGPLAEAAICGGVQGLECKARVMTPWGSDLAGQWSDKERHDAYIAHVRAAMSKHLSWVWALFDTAGASVVMAPEGVCFSVDTRPEIQWDVEALRPFAALTPFAESGETAH